MITFIFYFLKYDDNTYIFKIIFMFLLLFEKKNINDNHNYM